MKPLVLLVFVYAVILSTACSKGKSNNPPVVVSPTDTILAAVTKTFYPWYQFSMGADLSYVNEIEDFGGSYSDSGITQDPFLIFKNHGCNTVRVRLWYHPEWTYTLTGKYYSDINDVKKTIRRAKNAGMAVNLDFHYSDIWADPGAQATPEAWKSLDLATLSDSVYEYTSRVLHELEAENLVPEMVQVGNETNGGMLYPAGQVVNNNWTNFGTLLNSGIKAVRDFSVNAAMKPKIILHVAKPENADWWAGNVMNNAKVTDYDILGISYYYVWSSITIDERTYYNHPIAESQIQ